MSINTHNYDGKLTIHDLINIIYTLQKIDSAELTNEKGLLFTKLATELDSNQLVLRKHCNTAKRGLALVTRDIRKPPNYDHTNKLYADDILYLICKKDYSELLGHLAEQLSDIVTSGQCPQGRTIRLFSIFNSLYTNDDNGDNKEQ